MNKTKIVASIGPLSYKRGILEEMIIAGADVIRLNASYSDHTFCEKIFYEINEINKDLNSSVAIMFELEGPTIKTNKFKSDKVTFKTGDKIRMYDTSKTGDETHFSVDYKVLTDIKENQIIKLSFGKVILEVKEIHDNYAMCEVIVGGEVQSYSEVYFKDLKINRPFLTEQDKEDIKFACHNNADFLVISNVTNEENILEVNDLLIRLNNEHTSVLAKISNDIAIKNIDKIIEASDGIVIARNDLVITMNIENVPVITNEIIKKCRDNGKISIISADLSSFLKDQINPSRSEVSDLSNAVSGGVDSIILSSETTVGHYPVEAIKQVERIINITENSLDYKHFYEEALKNEVKNVRGTIISNAVLSILTLNCKAICVATESGFTAARISRFKPPCVIIAIVPNEKIAKSLNLYFGVIAVVIEDYNFDTLSKKAIFLAEEILKLQKHDKIVIVGGHPFNKDKYTNFIKIEEI